MFRLITTRRDFDSKWSRWD